MNGCPAMVSAPVLGGPGLASTANATLPGPVPDAVESVIQLTLVLAVHGQPAPVVTETDPLPPEPGTSWLDGAMLNTHPLACVIETVWSAIVTDPCRAGPVLEATAICTCPPPVPDAPAEIVIQVAPLLAAQEQPDAVLTWMFPLPACDPRDKLLGATATAHPDAWAIETVWSAIVTDPCRAGPVLEATATCTCPSPVPDAPAEIVSQSAPLVASQVQPEPALTWMVPVPACDPRDRLLGAIETVHPDAWLIVTIRLAR